MKAIISCAAAFLTLATVTTADATATGWAAAATRILSAKIVVRFGVPRFRPPRFVPGFDPLGICNSQVFRSGMWRAAIARRCLCSSLPAHIAGRGQPL